MRCINNLEVGNRLQQLRKEKGCKMIDVALEFDISTAQYSRLENGQGRISTDVLNGVCIYYHTTIDYILFGENITYNSIFFQKLQNYSEEEMRRMLKILSCLLSLRKEPEEMQKPFYKIFMGGLLEKIPVQAPSAIPYVLEYEKNLKRISENEMIQELGLTRFKWNSIMQGKEIHDIMIPLEISNQYGYDMNFLINNRLTPNLFFDQLIMQEEPEKRKQIMEIFDSVLTMQAEDGFYEQQMPTGIHNR